MAKLLIIIVISLISLRISVSTQTEQDEISFGQSNNDELDWSLIKAFTKTEESNVIISPFSIKLLLTILFEAAGEYTTTYLELCNVMRCGETDTRKLRESFKTKVESLEKSNDDYSLYLGSCIFMDHQNRINQKFGATVVHYYNTSIERQDFQLVDRSHKNINDWASRVTHNKINQIVSPSDVEDSGTLLVNVMYFHGSWMKPFKKDQTRISNFHIKSNQQIQASFIRQTGYFYYYESKNLNAKILRLQYKGDKFAMTIVLPNLIDGLDDLIQNSNITKFQSFKNDLTKVHVRISLPKFRFDYKAELTKTLQRMGIEMIFTNSAELITLTKVSRIIQSASIAVTEEGTTANSTVVGSFVKINSGTMEFIADHPFLFFIEDEKQGSIIFSGRVNSPTSGSL